MIPTKATFLAFVLAFGGGAALAQTQTATQTLAPSPTPGVGAPVRDVTGVPLGRVEAVITDPNGRPVQVVVRTRGVAGVRARSRAVPFESLRAEGGSFVTPLRRAEFDLLLPVNR